MAGSIGLFCTEALRLITGFTNSSNRQRLKDLTGNILVQLNNAIIEDGRLLTKTNTFLESIPEDIISDAENFILHVTEYLDSIDFSASSSIIKTGMMASAVTSTMNASLSLASDAASITSGLNMLVASTASNVINCFQDIGSTKASADTGTLPSALETEEQVQQEANERTLRDNKFFQQFYEMILESPLKDISPNEGPMHDPDDPPKYGEEDHRRLV